MNSFIAQLKDGSLSFGSPYNHQRFEEFAKKNSGKAVRIALVSGNVSGNQRGYYFGAVLPLMRQLVPEWAQASDNEMHAILKKNFGPKFTAFDPITKQEVRLDVSLASNARSNHKRMEDYLTRIGDWVMDNYGVHLPDPSEYIHERDSAPLREPLTPLRREKMSA